MPDDNYAPLRFSYRHASVWWFWGTMALALMTVVMAFSATSLFGRLVLLVSAGAVSAAATLFYEKVRLELDVTLNDGLLVHETIQGLGVVTKETKFKLAEVCAVWLEQSPIHTGNATRVVLRHNQEWMPLSRTFSADSASNKVLFRQLVDWFRLQGLAVEAGEGGLPDSPAS